MLTSCTEDGIPAPDAQGYLRLQTGEDAPRNDQRRWRLAGRAALLLLAALVAYFVQFPYGGLKAPCLDRPFEKCLDHLRSLEETTEFTVRKIIGDDSGKWTKTYGLKGTLRHKQMSQRFENLWSFTGDFCELLPVNCFMQNMKSPKRLNLGANG